MLRPFQPTRSTIIAMNTKKELSSRAFGTSLDSLSNASAAVNGTNKGGGKGGNKKKRASCSSGRSRSTAGEKRVTRSMSRGRATQRKENGGGAMDSLATIGLGKVKDIDATDDPQAAVAYVQDIYSILRAKESSTQVRPIYLAKQTQLNQRMRTILCDWLVSCHRKFKFVPETLYLAVSLVDRYLSRVVIIQRSNLQLVGVACLLIASKYEEIYCLALRDCVHVCAKAYSGNEILEMEWAILTELEFKIFGPTAYTFISRFLKAANADKRTIQMASFLLDGTLQNYKLLQYLPSQLAAAAVMIARKTIMFTGTTTTWTPALAHYTGYSEEEVMPVARAIVKAWSKRQEDCPAVEKKYSHVRYGSVALVTLPSASAFLPGRHAAAMTCVESLASFAS
mmetsp:Transcript_34440/g.101222  ORF Transcript_34440/g.101222 Transcript_34440/m.101222 type:complete len:396 (-) Transcript_34440:78-1265(-)